MTSKLRALVPVVLASTLLAFTAAQTSAQAPAQAPAATSQPATPAKPEIYDQTADAKAQIAMALARAKAENRRVLIQWGAEWCSWCHLLHGTFQSDPAVRKKLKYEYDLVLVDIGKWDKNMDLAAAYGADLKANGVPFLTVLDADGKSIANQETGSLEAAGADKPSHDPAKVLAFLTERQAPYLTAESVLSDGLARAKAGNKKVFLHFGAPWCGWCHRLEAWMAREDVAPVLARHFVPVKIDQDRTLGALEVLARYNSAGEVGIPWSALLNPDGSAVATTNGPDGNIGFPAAPTEIEWFAAMLAEAEVPQADIDILTESLRPAPEAPNPPDSH
jgi:thiol:disulfide interchange protein